MAVKNDGFRFTIQFNRNDPRHIQAANVLNLKGQRSKAAYLTEAILYYENGRAVQDINGMDLTSLIESIVINVLSKNDNYSAEPQPALAVMMDRPDTAPKNDDRRNAESVEVERAVRELGENGVRSIANAMAKLRRK